MSQHHASFSTTGQMGPDEPAKAPGRYYNKEKLLANGDRWEREIAKMIELHARYR
jgi:hypothetical protein